MENEEMLRSRARDRLTPRLFFICDKNLCYPVDATYALYDVGQRLGILDVCAMECENDHPPTRQSFFLCDGTKGCARRSCPGTENPAERKVFVRESLRLNTRVVEKDATL